jgi:hypothetical protein
VIVPSNAARGDQPSPAAHVGSRHLYRDTFVRPRRTTPRRRIHRSHRGFPPGSHRFRPIIREYPLWRCGGGLVRPLPDRRGRRATTNLRQTPRCWYPGMKAVRSHGMPHAAARVSRSDVFSTWSRLLLGVDRTHGWPSKVLMARRSPGFLTKAAAWRELTQIRLRCCFSGQSPC